MKLLFIAPMFYGYQDIIKRELEAKYDKVWFKNELPFNVGMLYYGIRRISGFLARVLLDKYNINLVKFVEKNRPNRIFIIRGCGIYEDTLKKIKLNQPGVEIVNYQWDSIHNNPNGLVISIYANRNYSFDLQDVSKYPQFTHIPLFHCWSEQQIAKARLNDTKKDIDLLFVGGYHSGRHIIVKKATRDIEQKGYKMWSHIFVPRLSYLRDKCTKRALDKDSLTTYKLSKDEYFELLCRSKVVLDIQSLTQTGATMRSIETLAASRKLVSTNKMLENEQFFSPVNIMIWNVNEQLELSELMYNDFDHSKDDEIYSVNQWITALNL